MSAQTYSYHPACPSCHGEGTTEETVPSYGGVGGFTIQTRACRACGGDGADKTRTISWVEDEEEVAPVASAPRPASPPRASTRAVDRARREGLTVGDTARPRTVAVHNSTKGMTYLVTRETCTCEAGRVGQGCKHRALAIHMFDVEGVDITTPNQRERVDSGWAARRVTA